MAKPPATDDPDTADERSTAKRDAVGNARTRTTPEAERAGPLEGPNWVTSLLLYGTDTLSIFPRTVKQITLGSAPGQSIVVASPFVSARHCRLERKRSTLRVTDERSKNGTWFEGAREPWFYLTPGKTFIVGARPHRFLALNDQMRASYPALVDILGAEREHAIDSAREPPSPSDVIVAATAGSPLLITSEPHCDQDRLARIVHGISLVREHPIVELGASQVPADRKAQTELIKRHAARSTLVLDLGDHNKPLDPAFVAMLFKPRHQVRVIVLARAAVVADKALGRQHGARLQEIWLRPVAGRPEAIDRLFDRMLEERNSPLRMSYLAPANQDAVRSHGWPENFASLRQAAAWLTAIYRLGSIHKAAHALQIAPATLHYWYSHTLKLFSPLSHRLLRRDHRD